MPPSAIASKGHMLFKHLLLLPLLLLPFARSLAQTLISNPNLSAFTRAATYSYTVDPTNGWVYVSGFGTRAMGLPRTGMVRVAPDGAVDANWQLAPLHSVFRHVAAANGDLYVYGRETASGPRIVARFSPAGSRSPAAIYKLGASDNDPNTGIGTIFAGRGRHIYVTDNISPGVTLRRIDTVTGLLDANWSYFTSNALFGIAQGAGADGALFVLEQQYPGLLRDMHVRRLDTGSTASVLWTKVFSAAESAQIVAADQLNQVYVITCKSYPSSEATVLRLDAQGNVDPGWNGASASAAVSQSRWNRSFALVDGRLVVAASAGVSEVELGQPGLRVYDQQGTEVASWSPNVAGSVSSLVAGRNGRLYVSVNGSLHVLSAERLQSERTLPLSFGSLGSIRSITKLPDGGRLLLGSFDVWYGGLRYRDVLRLRPDGTPNADWRVELDYGYDVTATVTRQGLLLVGRFRQVNGVRRSGAALVSLNGGAIPLDWTPGVELSGRSYVYDGRDTLYVAADDANGYRIRRLSMLNGQFDTDWHISAGSWLEQQSSMLGLDAADGIWLQRDAQTYFMEPSTTSLLQRFALASGRETMRTTIGTQLIFPNQFMATSTHVYIGGRRYRIAAGGERDVDWTSEIDGSVAALRTLAGGYLYYTQFAVGSSDVVMRRASLAGNGQADPGWTLSASALLACAPAEIPLFVSAPDATTDDAEFVIRCRDDLSLPLMAPTTIGDMALATTRANPVNQKTVVEYFSRDASRYFVTGRADEQAALDARSSSFMRTGMSFRSLEGTLYAKPANPVCRFYSSPERSGSNTHFYGHNDDCLALNTVSQLRFEGYDFAAMVPGVTGCPVSAPRAVTRLYNNKAPSNESNHRYVVSAATKAKMLSQGWVDEGVVFCSSAVTDVVN